LARRGGDFLEGSGLPPLCSALCSRGPDLFARSCHLTVGGRGAICSAAAAAAAAAASHGSKRSLFFLLFFHRRRPPSPTQQGSELGREEWPLKSVRERSFRRDTTNGPNREGRERMEKKGEKREFCFSSAKKKEEEEKKKRL
jgi:hypothetical protein